MAINLDDFPIPDNAGNEPREESIVAGGPAAYFSSLPLVAMRAALEKEGVGANISNTAGTYVCNHLFYHVMHHLSETGNHAQAGFIHIPVLPEERPEGAKDWPSLPRETSIQGVRVAIKTCVQTRYIVIDDQPHICASYQSRTVVPVGAFSAGDRLWAMKLVGS